MLKKNLSLHPPFVFTVIPTIQYGPQVFSTIEGTPISLPCRASGVPTPEITWAKVCIEILYGVLVSCH